MESAWRWVYTAQHKDTMRGDGGDVRAAAAGHVVVRWKTEAKSMAKIWRWFAIMLASLPRRGGFSPGRPGNGTSCSPTVTPLRHGSPH